MTLQSIEGGKRANEQKSLSVKINYKDGSVTDFECEFLGISPENPLLMTFMKSTEDDEVPVAIVNCELVKEMIINEV